MRNETTRGLVYRAFLLLTLLYVLVAFPDSFEDWVPVVIAFAGSGLATANTKLTR